MKRRLLALLVAATAVSLMVSGCDSREEPSEIVKRHLDNLGDSGTSAPTPIPDGADVRDPENRSLIKNGGWANVTVDGVVYQFARSHPESCHPTLGMLSVDLDLVAVDGAPADPNDVGVFTMLLLLPDGDPSLKDDEYIWLRIPVDGGRTYAAGDAIPGTPHAVRMANFTVETDAEYKVERHPFEGLHRGYWAFNTSNQQLMHPLQYFPNVIVGIDVFCDVTEG